MKNLLKMVKKKEKRPKFKTTPENAKKASTRLYAVQAVYQMHTNDQAASDVVEEYIQHRLGQDIDDFEGMPADGKRFKEIVLGVDDKKEGLKDILSRARSSDDSKMGQNEPLLYAILLCGAYELMTNDAVDPPIIISDYIDVAHSFYEGGESKLVNGILDKINKVINGAK